MRRSLLCAIILAAGSAAQAQIRLPSLPGIQPAVTQSLNQAQTPFRTVRDLRLDRIRRLIRDNRRLIEADPAGEPIIRGEILTSDLDDGRRALLEARGFVLDRERTSAETGFRLLVLRAPPRLGTRAALRELRAVDPNGVYDYNHIYLDSGTTPIAPPRRAVAARAQDSDGAPPPRVRAGLIDTGVDATHPAFGESIVHGWGCGGAQHPDAHGTAVASLLTAHAVSELYAADVYCGSPTGGSVDALAAAFGWLADARIAVINVSLVGPRNALLERIVGALLARGHVIVAAVGNDGPAAPPLYPAAYPGVVGVTGVDAQRRALLEAERGPQVMFAALGADLDAAELAHRYAPVRGTSFAAPTVAALLAATLDSPDRQAALGAIERLAQSAIHLGAPGRDLTYGWGLVGYTVQ